jgi:uncharacterized membrane protein
MSIGTPMPGTRKEEESMADFKAGARAPRLLHPFFVSLGGSLLIAALFTDYMYWSSALVQWSNFSGWLIAGGMVLALVSVIFLIVDLVLRKGGRIRRLDFILLAAAAILSLVNVLVHTRDAWTSVVPTGITLSVLVTLLLVAAGLRGWTVTTPGVAPKGDPQ